ncbi:MAG: type IX secretion system sortase PorU [Bacteroidales bacterium]|nr:type IX secretion system sortase PorU [Bacteroidales bacterium]
MKKRYSAYCKLQQIFLAGMFRILVAAVFMSVSAVVSAFPVTMHSSSSKLASGRWVRVSVTQTGMHCIPDATLRSWGFTDPSKVRVYGYGGNRLPEVLDSRTYMDDLPQTPSEYVAGRGVFFYALGPTKWAQSTAGGWAPSHNPYSLNGFYFLTADGDGGDTPRLEPEVCELSTVGNTVETFTDRLYHEQDLVSLGEAGFLLVGEDFRYQANQKFEFTLPGLATPEEDETNTYIEFSFVSATLLGEGRLSLSANGSALDVTPRDTIARISPRDSYTHGVQKILRKSYNAVSEKLSVGVGFSTSGTVRAAHLDYIAINYLRSMELPASRSLTIYMAERADASLGNAGSDTRVWDVTDPASVNVMETRTANGRMQWGSRSANRVYAAWDPAGTYPSPSFVGQVTSQNLHALPVPDMVIFTPDEWKSEAERLADFHRTDPAAPLTVTVLTPQAVYNEFSSGAPDAQAFRKCLKMFYDRSTSTSVAGDDDPAAGSLRYALFMSRPTYDPRLLTTTVAALGYPMLPSWCTDRGLSDNDSYNSDDIFAFLEDGSGSSVGLDKLSVAIGRLPVTSLSDAKASVNKILTYIDNAPTGLWRNNVVILADDGNNNRHLTQSESMCRNMEASFADTPGAGAIYKKIYIDAYEKISNTYPDARNELYRTLDEGALLWGFIGHANPASLTAERLVTYADLNSFYLRHWPMIYAATCDFMRWDSTTTSGAEILFKNQDGGVISVISATRPVFISNNGYLTDSFGKEFFRRGSDGCMRTIGEIYRDSKNNLKSSSGSTGDTNKLRYVLLGDPAMRLVYPNNLVNLKEVGGKEVVSVDGDEEPVQLMARQTTTMRGTVTGPAGEKLDDFNGTLTVTLYDADVSVTSNGYTVDNETSKKMTFDRLGGRLYLGSALVRNGEYELTVSMPAEVSNNYRQATLNMYALADDGRQANGVCRDLYVYGMDENSLPDDVPPVIETIYLNHPTFINGQQVNSAPMLLATVTDDRAINLSTAGLGHQMSLYLDDGAASYTDVSEYFTPNTDGTPGGTIAYPLSDLAAGPHSLRLRVWDTAPNSAEATVNFTVADGIVPTIHDVYTDRNPVSESANFYVSHDRPDQTVTVTIEVFDLIGRRVWTDTRTSRSDMFTSSPMTWDLTDSAGRRVGRGIYVYRAIVSDNDSGEKSATASRKLAVTGG